MCPQLLDCDKLEFKMSSTSARTIFTQTERNATQ